MTNGYPHAGARAISALVIAAVLTAVSAIGLPIARGAEVQAADGPVTFTLPPPTGPYRLGTFDMHLIDHDRNDPWAAGDAPRELMVSVWYPARHEPGAKRTPYMPEGVASFYDQASAELGVRTGDVDFLGAKTHAQTRAPYESGSGARPLVLYSPGGGVSRVLGSTLVEELVSNGYVVVTVDSTFQAPVEFPDGMRMPAHDVDKSQAMRERVADIRFVLDRLADVKTGGNPDAERRAIPGGLGRGMDLTRIGLFGHSMGGFATAETMLTDHRIDAGINLDGSMPADYGRAATQGADRPFLLMGAGRDGDTRHPHDHRGAPDWSSFWGHSTGWKRDLYIPDGEHMSFTDLQVILPQLDAELDLNGTRVRTSIGTVDPRRSLVVQRAYTTAFFDAHLRGRSQKLFNAPSIDHRVARFVR